MWRRFLFFYFCITDGNFFTNIVEAADCSITINSLKSNQPLLLKPNQALGVDAAFLTPELDGKISFNYGDTFWYSCPGSFISQPDKSVLYASLVLTCTTNGFMSGTEVYDVDKTECTNEIVQYTGRKCLQIYDEISIGFYVPDGRLLFLMTVCFDSDKKNALYSTFTLSKDIGGCVTSFPRVNFDAHLFGIPQATVDDLYKKVTQQSTINTLLGLPPNSNKYIDTTTHFYLAKGHLTAKCDFTYGSQQKLTFYYINTAPQWQTMNVGNWKTLEGSIRAYVQNQQKDFKIFTGTHGIATLEDSLGGQTQLFLNTNGGVREMPVPALFWKVLYDPNTKTGDAFLIINNPYQDTFAPICRNSCPGPTNPIPLKWKKDDQKLGFAYCCNLNDFLQVIPLDL